MKKIVLMMSVFALTSCLTASEVATTDNKDEIVTALIEKGADIDHADVTSAESSLLTDEFVTRHTDGTAKVWNTKTGALKGTITEPGTYATEGGLTITVGN